MWILYMKVLFLWILSVGWFAICTGNEFRNNISLLIIIQWSLTFLADVNSTSASHGTVSVSLVFTLERTCHRIAGCAGYVEQQVQCGDSSGSKESIRLWYTHTHTHTHTHIHAHAHIQTHILCLHPCRDRSRSKYIRIEYVLDFGFSLFFYPAFYLYWMEDKTKKRR